MDRVQKEGGDLLNGYWGEGQRQEKLEVEDEPDMVQDGMTNLISIKELRQHKNTKEPWIVINNEVYDATEFLEDHPGGPESITAVAGGDATEDFLAIHSMTAKQMLADFHIGTLDSSSEKLVSSPEKSVDSSRWLSLPISTGTMSKCLNTLVAWFWRS